ncbi:MAG: hypothetical protein IKF41_03975 [Alphaproteobacteria bacterium]|nr:hypothetical protein [Alphaproteobacteria bacterium]
MPDDFIKNHHGINIKYPTSDQDKNAQKIKDDFNKAKQAIIRKIIQSDNSDDRTAVRAVMAQFRKTNE